MKGKTPIHPTITNRVPLNTLYFGLSNLGQRELKNAAEQTMLIDVIQNALQSLIIH
jgi:hypothetical protein